MHFVYVVDINEKFNISTRLEKYIGLFLGNINAFNLTTHNIQMISIYVPNRYFFP